MKKSLVKTFKKTKTNVLSVQRKQIFEDKPNATENVLLKPLMSGNDKAILYWDALEQRIDIMFLRTKEEFKNAPSCAVVEKKIGRKKYYGFITRGSGQNAEMVNQLISGTFKIMA